MTKKGLAAAAVLFALLLPRAAAAQSDAPQWLRDRRYNEGIGVREGDFELHPGIAGEVGYDSNYFLRSAGSGYANSGGSPNFAPPIPALVFRVTPSLYISTIGPQRREGDLIAQPPSVRFRAGINATYREFIGVSSDSAASLPQNDISAQRNISGNADARLEIAPERPFGAVLYANYGRFILPTSVSSDPNLSLNRDEVGAGGELVAQPGAGTLDWRFGYTVHDTLFEESVGQPYDNLVNRLYTRGRWKFRPRTALIYDASFDFTSYQNQSQALAVGLVNSTPVRTRIGLNGLITDRFTLTAMVGWGAGFYQTIVPAQPQYDSVIAQAELKWFLSASPGLAQSADVGLSLSSIAIGYTRDFQNSYIGDFYGQDRGYLRFNYFFAGRALVALEGGVSGIEYPNMYWGPDAANPAGGDFRHSSFTDLRVDSALFGEYRFTDSFGLNATVRYTANFSNAVVPDTDLGPGVAVPAAQSYDMSWSRFETFVGLRFFL
ncbi:MAG TPA: hypothetical protein VGL81_08300 [Polyangiaceae bacterium]|jgi:hypothetical protein